MKISIIIPVYNVKKYLKKCIESVLMQDCESCEVILVDDGSTDGSGELCDEFMSENSSVHVIHQTNGGLSRARNIGMYNAQGEYILFLDSDDWIQDGSIKVFLNVIRAYPGIDLIVGKAKSINDNGLKKDKTNYAIQSGKYEMSKYLSLLKKTKGYLACAPFYVYRRQFILNQGIKFMEGIIHEDELWTPNVLTRAKNIYVTDEYFYYHYVREGSINRSGDLKKSGENLLIVVSELEKLLSAKNKSDYEIIKDQMIILYLQAICFTGDAESLLLDKKTVYRNSRCYRTKIKVILYCISPKLYILIHNGFRRN